MKRLYKLAVLSTAVSAAFFTPATMAKGADGYPSKPITLVVPYAAGGTTDLIGRALGASLSKQLGQTIVVENKPGAAGSMGANEMVNTKPDGYKLALTPVGIFRQPYLQKTRYDPVKDLSYIAAFASYDFALGVDANSPYKTLDDLLKHAKEKPRELTISSPGRYSGNHVAIVELAKEAGVQMTHVPYKSDSEAIGALMGGHLDAVMSTNVIIPFMESGKVRVLGVAAEKRPEAFADIPTLTESGYSVVIPSPLGIAGPKGLPQEIVEKLDLAVKAAMEDPGFLKVIKDYGVRTYYMDNKAYTQFAIENFENEKDVIERMGDE
ncbi:MAG: tripartite tricarboxylate transporter substrate binding protein [Alcaligenaceae bacterium]|nr:tripartite tricarboxylate transporter substrate binding protein [Alcaligenaceae bacterium]